MTASNYDYNERSYLLPVGCRDLLDIIKLPKAPEPKPTPYPPITRKVTLPDVVAVRFLVEASGQELDTIVALMNKLRIGVDVNRSVDFGAAQKVLRHFGIWAERGGIRA
jgi:hypothetical protein